MAQLGKVLGHVLDDQDAERVGPKGRLQGLKRDGACAVLAGLVGSL